MLIADPGLQELNRRHIAKSGMAAFSVGFRLRGIAGSLQLFVLQAVEETLR